MLTVVLGIGLIGAVLMFCGDMLLYFDRNDYEQTGTLEPVIRIMRKLPEKRIMAGGLIGPVAAFLYCVGFYHIVLITSGPAHNIAFASFLINCFGVIAGGAYHSHYVYLGLLGRDERRNDLNIVLRFIPKLSVIMYIAESIGLLMLIFLIVTGKTVLPVWMAVLTPGALFLLTPLVRKLPKGLHMIICGGFSNIIFIVYYLFMLVLCIK